jgi:zinc protease
MAFPGPARNAPDRHAAEVWAAVASGLGGRLFESLRSQRSLAYTVLASSWQRGGAGALLTYIATAPEREEEARQEMLIELERFRHEAVSPAELSQAINYLAGQAEVARQSSGAVLGEILEAWLIGDGLSELLDPAQRYRGVTVDEVRVIGQRYLAPERRAEGIVRGSLGRAGVHQP